MEYTDSDILFVMRGLGITQADIMRAKHDTNTLEALKTCTKKAYRRLVQELHPDKTGDDPDKARLFQLATHVVKEINNMKAHSSSRRIKWAVRVRSVSVR